jgi:hypothetical protein
MNQRKKKKQQPKLWLSYEEVAAYLLDRFAKEFGLSSVKGKQKVPGLRSGTPWEIDAKGITEDGKGFFIVECRRYTSSKQNQGNAGKLAYSMIDSGAAGGIVVSPLGKIPAIQIGGAGGSRNPFWTATFSPRQARPTNGVSGRRRSGPAGSLSNIFKENRL